jgi:hypothetical protein
VENGVIDDLSGTTISDASGMVDKVYRDHVDHNDGSHLDGGYYVNWKS